MVGFPDIASLLRDPAVVNTIVILTALSTASAWLYRRFRKPKLEVSLEPVTSYPDPEYAIPEQSPRTFKSQALRLRAKRKPIHQCKAKMSIDGEPDYLLWDPKSTSEAKNFVPEEEVQLHVWQAMGMSKNAWFYLNIKNKAQIDLKALSDPIIVEISFLSETGLLNKQPYRYKIWGGCWDTVKMVSLPLTSERPERRNTYLSRNQTQELRAPFKALSVFVRAMYLFGAATFPAWYWSFVYVVFSSSAAYYPIQPLPGSLTAPVMLFAGVFGTWVWWKVYGARLTNWILHKSTERPA